MTRPFQLFPPLDPATEQALRFSIERFGVIVPIVVDQHGQIIDGHHRRRIADELGVEVPTRQVEVSDADVAREMALTLNTDRRHMPPDQRREVVAALRYEGHSMRAIAKAVGVNHSTVVRDANRGGAGAPPETVRGQDGKTYPATKPKNDPPREEDEVQQTQNDSDQEAATRTSLRSPLREMTQTEREGRIQKIREMSAEGHSASQIGAEVYPEAADPTAHVRLVARKHGIKLVDHVIGKRRLVESSRVVDEAVIALDAVSVGLSLVDYSTLDADECVVWDKSLNDSMRVIKKMHQQIKERMK